MINDPGARPAIAVGLPLSEAHGVFLALQDAGYEPVHFAGPGDLGALLDGHDRPSVAIIDLETDMDAALAAWKLLQQPGRTVPALIVARDTTLQELDLAAIGALDDEYLTRPFGAEAIRWQVEAMHIRSTVVPDGSVPMRASDVMAGSSQGSVVAVFNPKGGVGKTTVAVNLAVALVLRRAQRVLLVDADTVTGHVAGSLGLDGIRTVADAWTEELDGGPLLGMEDLAAVHTTGLRVAALSSSPIQAEILEPQRVAGGVARARRGVDWVVVDLHGSYDPLNRAILELADRVLVPVTPDLPAIRTAVQLREVADDLGFLDRLALVINRVNSGVSVADLEDALQMRALAQIRSGGLLMVQALNEGRTVVEMAPRERISRDFEQLADRVLGTPVRENTSRQRFQLLRRTAALVQA
jgi:pilus assembly protein CpaE